MREIKKKPKEKQTIKKDQIELFKANISVAKFHNLVLDEFLARHLKGYFTLSKIHILKPGDYLEDLILVTAGVVIVYYLDEKSKQNVELIFRAGQMVLLPALLDSGKISKHFFSTSTHAEYVVLAKEQYRYLCKMNVAEKTFSYIVSRDYLANLSERDEILRKYGNPRVLAFFERFAELKGETPKVNIERKMIASFIAVLDGSLSRSITRLKERGWDW